MDLFKKFRLNVGRVIHTITRRDEFGQTVETPVIRHRAGTTPEWARRQAAVNMRLNSALREEVICMLAVSYGSRAAGEAEARRRYPEAFDVNIPLGAR